MVNPDIATVINNSPFFSGCMMLIMNFGGRHINDEIPDAMNDFFKHPIVKKITIFGIAFAATRNIKTALLITLIFILFTRYLMNQNSMCCIPGIKKLNKQKVRSSDIK